MKKTLLLFIPFLLIACATPNTELSSAQQKKPRTYTTRTTNIPRTTAEVIEGLSGCKKDYVFKVLGIPDREKMIDNKKYFVWDLSGNGACTVNAYSKTTDIIDSITSNDFANGCKYFYVRIVRYYRANPPQNKDVCPNRTDFHGIYTTQKTIQ